MGHFLSKPESPGSNNNKPGGGGDKPPPPPPAQPPPAPPPPPPTSTPAPPSDPPVTPPANPPPPPASDPAEESPTTSTSTPLPTQTADGGSNESSTGEDTNIKGDNDNESQNVNGFQSKASTARSTGVSRTLAPPPVTGDSTPSHSSASQTPAYILSSSDIAAVFPVASSTHDSPSIAAAFATKSPNIAPIVAGVLVPLFLLLLGAAAFLAYKRRQKVRDREEWIRTHAEIAHAVREVGGPVTVPPASWTRFDGSSAGQSQADLAQPSDSQPFFGSDYQGSR